MALDDFKNTWDEMGKQVEGKQIFNPEIFNKMNNRKLTSKLQKIIIPEILGGIICLGSAIYIAFHFYQLNTVPFKIVGIASIFLLILLPVISLFSIQHLYKSTDIGKSYAGTLKGFAVQKLKFFKLQKLNITLSYLLLATLMILVTKLVGKHNNDENAYFMIFGFCFGYIVLLFFSKWVFKKYNRIIQQTENFLKELSA